MTASHIRRRVNMLSDEELYERAVKFARENPGVSDAQLNGLLQYAHNWPDLQSFVDRQEKRDWAGKDDYGLFYAELKKELQRIDKIAGQLIPEGIEPRDRRAGTELCLGLLGHDFVQHLVAEMQFARSRNQDNHGRPATSLQLSDRPVAGQHHSRPAHGHRRQPRSDRHV
jgi:hypothetical protein